MKKPKITSGKTATPFQPGASASSKLPDRSALMKLAKGKKTTNDYSKAGPSIVQNGTTIIGDTQE